MREIRDTKGGNEGSNGRHRPRVHESWSEWGLGPQRGTWPQGPQRPTCRRRMTRSLRTHRNPNRSGESWSTRAVTPRAQLLRVSCRRWHVHRHHGDRTTRWGVDSRAFAKARYRSRSARARSHCMPSCAANRLAPSHTRNRVRGHRKTLHAD